MKKFKSVHDMDMTHGSLAGKLLLFAVPLMLSSILQLLFNAADVVVVGRYAGKAALAAVGSTTSIINLIINIFMGLSVGANVVIAHDFGSNEPEKVRLGVHTSITLAIIGGVFLTILGTLMARTLLVWTSSPADVIGLATLYLRIYFLGMPANLLYNFGASILRAQGDTRRPLYILFAAGVINAGLNIFFVRACSMSVDGVALATIISQYLSAVLVVLCLIREKGQTHLDIRALGLDKNTVRRILRVGVPAGFQGMVFSLSNVVVQSAINSFDDTAIVAGASAAANIEGFVYVAMNAFYQTDLTFTSQNYGAGEVKRVDRSLVLCQIYVVVTGLVFGNLAASFGHELASIYAPGEEDVIAQAVLRMNYVCRLYFLCGMMDTMVGVMRGLGYSVMPMMVSMIGGCGLRILWVQTVFAKFRTTPMLYISYPITWAITAAVHFVVFLFLRRRAYGIIKHEKKDEILEISTAEQTEI